MRFKTTEQNGQIHVGSHGVLSGNSIGLTFISLSPAIKRGVKAGFSWDQCWGDCLNKDYLNVY